MDAPSPCRWLGTQACPRYPDERNNWELIGNGQGIRWPDLDEDLSVEGFIAGRRSGESQRSLKRWLEARLAGWSVLLYDLAHGEPMSDGEPPRTPTGGRWRHSPTLGPLLRHQPGVLAESAEALRVAPCRTASGHFQELPTLMRDPRPPNPGPSSRAEKPAIRRTARRIAAILLETHCEKRRSQNVIMMIHMFEH